MKSFWTLIVLTCCYGVFCDVSSNQRPNVIIFLADDLGYGDLSGLGHPSTRSPNIDYLFRNGKVLTQFYTISPVCSPSRAAMLTGKYPIRTGVWPGVFWPDDVGGLPTNESTIATYLKQVNYSTALIGKWHLGYGKNFQYHPKKFGFDLFYGIPYSHDMCPCPVCYYPNDSCSDKCSTNYVDCPLFENDNIIMQPVNLTTLTQLYTRRSFKFIHDTVTNEKSFFLMMSYHQPHHPQFAGKRFRNCSNRGPFGDSIKEMDWSIGQVLKLIKELGQTSNTIIFFTSDNGPSLNLQPEGGSAGLFRCGKGTTYEGGLHIPAVVYWQNKILPGSSLALSSMMDILPTILNLVGITLPSLDGDDLANILFNNSKSGRESLFLFPYYSNQTIGMYAMRYKQYKAHFLTEGSDLSALTHDSSCTASKISHNPPLLFNIHQDPSENINLAHDIHYKEILQQIYNLKEEFEKTPWYPSEKEKGKDESIQPCCKPGCRPFPTCCKCENNKHSLEL